MVQRREKPFNLRTLPDIPTKAVKCIVTSRKVGISIVYAYDYNKIEAKWSKKRCYKVPLYHMILTSDHISKPYTFHVIRFGVIVGHKGDYLYAMPAMHRKLKWQDQYRTGAGIGGWRIGDTNALIHDGSNRPRKKVWGAAGCIEITGLVEKKDAWTVFNQKVRELSSVSSDWSRLEAHKLIQKNESFTCVLQPVERPGLKPVNCP